MSKGTLSPRTVRFKENFKSGKNDKLKQNIIDYDNQFESFYNERNKKLKEKKEIATKVTSIADSLGKYSASEFAKVKANHEKFVNHFKSFKCPDSVLDSTEVPEEITFTSVYKYRAIGEKLMPSALNSPIVLHFGINAQKAVFLSGRGIEKAKLHPEKAELHPIETALLTKAIDKLTNEPSAAQVFSADLKENYQNNVVLMDIIARKDMQDFNTYTRSNQHLKTCTVVHDNKTKNIETHTVVLWKKEDKKIALIDPNDDKFSEFLNGQHIDSYTIQTELKNNKIYLPEPQKNKGGTPRDCTDIAVKIAFELIEQQKNQGCQAVKTALDNMVKQISNNKNISDNFKYFKFFQSSDYALRKSARDEVSKFEEKYLKIINAEKLSTPDDMYEALDLLGQLKEADNVEVLFS